jgi:uncharacterized protein (TIGR02246 family)
VSDAAARIEALVRSFERALNSFDADLAADCYTSDGSFMTPGQPTAEGPQVRETYARIFGHVRLTLSFGITEIIPLSDEWVYLTTRSRGIEQDLATGEARPDSNREGCLLKRTREFWKIRRLIFNKAP